MLDPTVVTVSPERERERGREGEARVEWILIQLSFFLGTKAKCRTVYG